MAMVDAKKATKPAYSEVTQMEILTAFEETMKEMEREEAHQKK
eukprot:CAMPEP_0170477562 /NCGR_PEP_ID=MMETSP0123-20130129/18795_1 /TAXON_ID=182087 /ORGANISM="Favella ehrenbergii, Strain Fehren 1" /LENGTH=42 /DNA_ID= /DNA_START= /DNA_END= /DNA_ORIENTATION=